MGNRRGRALLIGSLAAVAGPKKKRATMRCQKVEKLQTHEIYKCSIDLNFSTRTLR